MKALSKLSAGLRLLAVDKVSSFAFRVPRSEFRVQDRDKRESRDAKD